MPDKEINAIYETLKENGDLFNIFPDMTGEWEKDRKRFTKEYGRNEIMLGDIEICDSETEDFDLY